MKSHNGMRPQDVVVLLKILIIPETDWQYRDLAATLFISISEISESLNRSQMAGLADGGRRKVHRQALMEFIQHGLHYVFPPIPVGGLQREGAKRWKDELRLRRHLRQYG